MIDDFDRCFHRVFFSWGHIVYHFRYLLFILPILLTAILSTGFLFIKSQTTIDPKYVFSPKDAPWKYELGVLQQYWPLNEQEFWPGKSYDYDGYLDVIAAGIKNETYGRPNMLLQEYLNELSRINQYIIHNITVPFDHKGKHFEIAFTDICMSYEWKCYHNDHIILLMPKSKWGNFTKSLAEFTKDIIDNEIKVTYPIGWRGTEPIYFGALIGAPHLIDEEGHFDYIRAIRLTYNVKDDKLGDVSYQWRKKVSTFLADKENPPSKIIEFGFYHNESLPEGLQQVADELTPKFILTFSLLFIVCELCSIVLLDQTDFITFDWVRSKPIVVIAGLMCPLLATFSAFGILLWCGSLFNAIVNVSPFIVISIGVDDMFIMIAVWHRTNSNWSTSRRLAETLSEAAVAISITSITDMLSFGIGCLTTLPSVQMFCLYTLAGVFFTYAYQLTFFTAALGITGEWEAKGLHIITFKRALEPNEANTIWKRLLFVGSLPKMNDNTIETDGRSESITTTEKAKYNTDKIQSSYQNRLTLISKFFREIYGPFLLSDLTKTIVFFIYIIYFALSVYGCTQVEEGLNPKFLIKETFYLNKFYVLMDETFWNEGLQMQVVVNSPPNLFNESQKMGFWSMVNEYESTHFTMNHNATMLWLSAFEAELKKQMHEFSIPPPTSRTQWYERCHEWLIVAGGRRLWEKDMYWCIMNKSEVNASSQPRVELCAFRFQVGLRNYRSASDHMHTAQLMRRIASKYAQFNVSTFQEYYPFADQYIELKPALIRNCILALLSMFAVSLLLIPNIWVSFVIAAVILSIDIGLVGFMTFWGVRLESVSMITVIMSIGFAIDLSAHIGYAYVKADGDKNMKAIQALENIGWPVFMGAFSTMVGILALSTVDAYIIQIFFKTVFLVILFSLIHGLIFLPVFLTIFIPTMERETRSNDKDMMKGTEKYANGQTSSKDLTKSLDHR